MAARVGTAVTGAGDAAAVSISSSAKSTTTGNALCVGYKWENNSTLDDVQDTAGNIFTIVSQSIHANTFLRTATALCKNATGHASNVVTGNFSSNPEYRRIIVEEVSGLETTGGTDGEAVNSGSGTTYSTGAIATTGPGWVFGLVGGYTSLSGKTAGGSPASTLGGTISDTFNTYLVSDSAQSVTPGASANESNAWMMRAFALKGVETQILHPNADVSAGAWRPSVGSDMYSVINDSLDADYVNLADADGDTFEVALQDGVDPASSSGHVVSYRLRGRGGQITVSLRQGSSTEIAAWTHDVAPGTFGTFVQTLSGGEADAITDYSDLRLRFVAAL